MTDNSHRAVSAARTVADALAAEITSGALPPGAPLPTVRELCKTHGVGERTVLNALELLDADYLITRRANTRARVAAPDTELRALRTELATLATKIDTLRTQIDTALARHNPTGQH